MKKNIIKLTLLLLVLLALVVACNESSKPNKLAVLKEEKKIVLDDLKVVCNSTGMNKATVYDKTVGKVSKISHFYRKFVADDYASRLHDLPSAWIASWKNPQESQLVVCSTITSAKKALTCPFTNKKTNRVTKVIGYNSTFEVNVFEAKTGTKLGAKTFHIKFKGCPKYHFFIGDTQEDIENSYPTLKQPLIDYLQKFVVKR